nr:MAG TPA: Roseltide rT7, PLANT PROTEIN [Caudoviricetes sp.]
MLPRDWPPRFSCAGSDRAGNHQQRNPPPPFGGEFCGTGRREARAAPPSGPWI